jgi:hypothetical protein
MKELKLKWKRWITGNYDVECGRRRVAEIFRETILNDGDNFYETDLKEKEGKEDKKKDRRS